jgi:hypothetical protein
MSAPPTPVSAPVPAGLEARWRGAWPQALARWSNYTQLREPTFLASDQEAKTAGMAGEIAAIRLVDQTVLVNLRQVAARGLDDLALPILAHEIGHHVYVPGNLADNARMLAAIKPVLFGLTEDTAPLVCNLYGDLLINDRLQRRAGVDVAAVYRKLHDALLARSASEGGTQARSASEGTPPGETSSVWKVYTRTYEILWRLPPGTLAPPDVTAEMNADAALLARLIRHYAADWLRGARRFACILYPYLHDDQEKKRAQTFLVLGLCDTRCAGCRGGTGSDADAIPGGIIGIDPAELGGDDDFDRELDDPLGDADLDVDPGINRRGRSRKKGAKKPRNTAPTREGKGTPRSQCREPFEYGELLRALGLNLEEHEITTRYYRERSLPYLIPFPVKKAPQAKEPLPEGYETWDAGEPLEALDVFGSLLRSPHVIPGVTTVQRVFGESPGSDPARLPLDLDIYVDCSGSMPNPAVNVSYLALAGTILALSALRAGARVQATLWSGAGQFDTSGGFIRDEKRILGIVTGYIAGSTAFPLHVLRETYRERKASEPPAHVVVISDEGADTMLDKDEEGNKGEGLCKLALQAARGGGTLVLNLPNEKWKPRQRLEKIGFRVHAVRDWEELVAFARAFVRDNYE